MNALQADLENLSNDEQNIRGFLETHLVDDCGLVLSTVNADTLKPWTAEELEPYASPDLHFSNRARFPEIVMYENALMATGEYARSQIARFEATSSPAALAAAASQVSAILRVYHEGEWHEKGYLPKPHGGIREARLSHQISPDQYIKCVMALHAWRPHASPSQRRAIDSYLVATADYFISRKFTHPWRDRVMVAPETIFHSLSLFIPILWIAADLTGEDRYLHPLERLRAPIDTFLDEEKRQPIYGIFNITTLMIEGFHLAMKLGDGDERLRETIRTMWELALSQTQTDGSGIHSAHLPLFTAEVVRLASVAPLVEACFPDIGAADQALVLLRNNRDPRQMLYFHDHTNRHALPPEEAYMGRSIDETAVTGWLLGYWRLRQASKR